MVTTVIAWVAGITLVVVAANEERFQRVLDAAARTSGDVRERVERRSAQRVFVQTCRALTLAVGAICIALGVLGVWSRL
jgi:hypothetical protein